MRFPATNQPRAAMAWRLSILFSFLLWPGLAQAGLWVTGYYPGYRQTAMPPSVMDFSAMTHVIHFSIKPLSDGSVVAANSIKPAFSTDLVTRAHAAGIKALIS